MNSFYVFSIIVIVLAGVNLFDSLRRAKSRERTISVALNSTALICMGIALIIKAATE